MELVQFNSASENETANLKKRNKGIDYWKHETATLKKEYAAILAAQRNNMVQQRTHHSSRAAELAGLVQGVKDFMRKHVKDQENAASSHIGHDQMSSAGDGRKVFVLFEDGSLEVPVNEDTLFREVLNFAVRYWSQDRNGCLLFDENRVAWPLSAKVAESVRYRDGFAEVHLAHKYSPRSAAMMPPRVETTAYKDVADKSMEPEEDDGKPQAFDKWYQRLDCFHYLTMIIHFLHLTIFLFLVYFSNPVYDRSLMWHSISDIIFEKPFLSKDGETSLTFDEINGADDFWQWIDGNVKSSFVNSNITYENLCAEPDFTFLGSMEPNFGEFCVKDDDSIDKADIRKKIQLCPPGKLDKTIQELGACKVFCMLARGPNSCLKDTCLCESVVHLHRFRFRNFQRGPLRLWQERDKRLECDQFLGGHTVDGTIPITTTTAQLHVTARQGQTFSRMELDYIRTIQKCQIDGECDLETIRVDDDDDARVVDSSREYNLCYSSSVDTLQNKLCRYGDPKHCGRPDKLGFKTAPMCATTTTPPASTAAANAAAPAAATTTTTTTVAAKSGKDKPTQPRSTPTPTTAAASTANIEDILFCAFDVDGDCGDRCRPEAPEDVEPHEHRQRLDDMPYRFWVLLYPNPPYFNTVVNQLLGKDWIDVQTRTVGLNFNLYNPTLELVATVQAKCDFDYFGNTKCTKSIMAMPFQDTGYDNPEYQAPKSYFEYRKQYQLALLIGSAFLALVNMMVEVRRCDFIFACAKTQQCQEDCCVYCGCRISNLRARAASLCNPVFWITMPLVIAACMLRLLALHHGCITPANCYFGKTHQVFKYTTDIKTMEQYVDLMPQQQLYDISILLDAVTAFLLTLVFIKYLVRNLHAAFLIRALTITVDSLVNFFIVGITVLLAATVAVVIIVRGYSTQDFFQTMLRISLLRDADLQLSDFLNPDWYYMAGVSNVIVLVLTVICVMISIFIVFPLLSAVVVVMVHMLNKVVAESGYFWVKTKREEKAGRFSREDTDQIDKMFARDTYSSTANVEQE